MVYRSRAPGETSIEKRAGTRAGKGEVRAAVLALLAERPMRGYQIIPEIEDPSGGNWKLSAGSVYPTLQLLADESDQGRGIERPENLHSHRSGREEVTRDHLSERWNVGRLPRAVNNVEGDGVT